MPTAALIIALTRWVVLARPVRAWSLSLKAEELTLEDAILPESALSLLGPGLPAGQPR